MDPATSDLEKDHSGKWFCLLTKAELTCQRQTAVFLMLIDCRVPEYKDSVLWDHILAVFRANPRLHFLQHDNAHH